MIIQTKSIVTVKQVAKIRDKLIKKIDRDYQEIGKENIENIQIDIAEAFDTDGEEL